MSRPLRSCGTPYKGMNVLWLWMVADMCGYAAEELIAELSSAMLGAELGLPVAHLDHHASYIGHWLKLLKDDERAILTAAARAEEAAALVLRLGRGETDTRSDGQTDDHARDSAALAA